MSNYKTSHELEEITKVAMFLKRPLLLAGEPGCGKTTYAKHISEIKKTNYFEFHTKSISEGQDLFYTYDAVGHFAQKEKSALEFITFKALGCAILAALGKDEIKKLLAERKDHPQLKIIKIPEYVDKLFKDIKHETSVVLIDEIDKAPKDFPNDILNEIERYCFTVKEIDVDFKLDDEDKSKIFVLMTSNFEKNLPNAFLRRCLFFHISFPKKEKLVEILEGHLALASKDEINLIELASYVNSLLHSRTDELIKKPSVSEFIDCIKWVYQGESQNPKIKVEDLLKSKIIHSILFKKQDDLNKAIEIFGNR